MYCSDRPTTLILIFGRLRHFLQICAGFLGSTRHVGKDSVSLHKTNGDREKGSAVIQKDACGNDLNISM